jgi:hypothetical protein
MAALFALFTIEMYLKAKTGGHSHGGATGQIHTASALAAQGVRPGVVSQSSLPGYGSSLRVGTSNSTDFEKPHAYTTDSPTDFDWAKNQVYARSVLRPRWMAGS